MLPLPNLPSACRSPTVGNWTEPGSGLGAELELVVPLVAPW